MSTSFFHDVDGVIRDLNNLLDGIDRLHTESPKLLGAKKFRNRVSRELKAATRIRQLATARQYDELHDVKLVEKVQGVRNNYRGLAAELETAKSAPGLVALSYTFPLYANPGHSTGGSGDIGPKTVEVDVVAQQGHLWIEVKDSEIFGLGSTRWRGSPGKFSGWQQTYCRFAPFTPGDSSLHHAMYSTGLQYQAKLQLTAAQRPHNWKRWQPVKVLFYFPSGVGEEVASELRSMGALVQGAGPLSSHSLPQTPSMPARTNLDVTTLCAICSEVCNGGVHSQAVREWASRTAHWQECLAAEVNNPLLPQILPYIGQDRQLFSTESVVCQFQLLIEQFGGAKEKDRWEKLAARLAVVPDDHCGQQSSRRDLIPCMQSISREQKTMLIVGDSLKAITLTANSRAVQSAAAHGLHLEAFTHRAVWLTGL